MPNGMDYSLKNRVIDGTGMILDTSPGSPDQGSYVTESQLADWIKGKILFAGYYYNGDFYSDSGHTTLLAKVNGALYIDQTNANKALYVCLSSTYQSLTEEAQVQAILDGLADGTIVPLKARQDQNGNVIDQTYETKAEASELKGAVAKNTAEIENLKQTSAQTEITVSYPDDGNYSALMPNLVPQKSAKYAEIKSIVGKSRAWNQLLNASNVTISSGTIGGATLTNNTDGSITLNGTTTGNDSKVLTGHLSITAGHKYLIFGAYSSNMRISVYANNGSVNVGLDEGSGLVFEAGTYTNMNIRLYFDCLSSGQSFSNVKHYIIIRDLTLIFPDLPSTDLVTSNIPALVKRCPDLLTYDAFGQSIVDETETGVKAVGMNIWNGEKEVGNINGVNGQNTPSSSVYRSVGYTRVEPSTDYYFYNSTAGNTAGALFFYDYNKNYITLANNSRNTKVTTPPNCYYIRMAILIENFGTGVQICLDSASDKTSYHPYMTGTLSLPSPVTLRSAGSVAEVYDLETGEKSNPLGVVDLGNDLEYDLYGTFWRSRTAPSNIKAVSSASDIANILHAEYQVDSASNIAGGSILGIAINASGYVLCNNGSTSIKPSGNLYYELATPLDPTQITPVINNTLKVEPNGTVETVQDNTYPDDSPAPTIDNSMTVNFDLIP